MSQHSKNILHFITHIINITQCTTVQAISRLEYDNNIQLSQKEMLLVRSITNVIFTCDYTFPKIRFLTGVVY